MTSLILSASQVRAALAGTLRQIWIPVTWQNSYANVPKTHLWDFSRARVDRGLDVPGNEYLHVPFAHPEDGWQANPDDDTLDRVRCRYKVGLRLIVRETFIAGWPTNEIGESEQYDDDGNELPQRVWYRADSPGLRWLSENGDGYADNTPWKSASTMPLWASRLTLPPIAGVQATRTGSILTNDALAAGFTAGDRESPSDAFHNWWDARYGTRYPWASNPHCWKLTIEEVGS